MMIITKSFAERTMVTELESRIECLTWILNNETLSTCSARRINDSIEKFQNELDELVITNQMKMEASL